MTSTKSLLSFVIHNSAPTKFGDCQKVAVDIYISSVLCESCRVLVRPNDLLEDQALHLYSRLPRVHLLLFNIVLGELKRVPR